jgi:hypothetical protein
MTSLTCVSYCYDLYLGLTDIEREKPLLFQGVPGTNNMENMHPGIYVVDVIYGENLKKKGKRG